MYALAVSDPSLHSNNPKRSQMYKILGIITGMTVRVEILRVCSWWKCDHSEPSICISFVHVVPIKGTSPS